MFLFKKMVGPLFLPLTLCLILLTAGAILVWFQKKGRSGKILVTAGVLLLALTSYGAVANWSAMPLECRYPPLRISDAAGARWVAVLGGGFTPNPQDPATSRLNGETLSRLAEGIRLYRKIPGCKLLLSGGAVFHTAAEAEVMAGAARDLGVREKDMVLESASRDTEDQARTIRDIVGGDKFILVTSALHMPRAVALFEKEKMKPLPAPAGICPGKKETTSPNDFFPNAEALRKTESALHEYLGILWAKMRGKI